MAAALKKAAGKSPSRSPRPAKVEERKKINRIGTHVNDDPEALDTIGKRMTARRLELGLTQSQVAEQVIYTPKKGKRSSDDLPLSRNAYCTYETGSVEPDLPKIEVIAEVLETTPGWLAFGTGERKQEEEYFFDPKKNEFKSGGSWILGEEWLKDSFGASPDEIGLFVVTDYSPNFNPGDAAIIRRNVEPTTSGGEFIFAYKGNARIAQIARLGRTDSIRVFSADLKTHEEIPLKSVTLLGKVVGKISATER